jgi:hypothetical protein
MVIPVNGLYYNGTMRSYADGVDWGSAPYGHFYSLPYVTMKTRPVYNCLDRTTSCNSRGECSIYDKCECDAGWYGSNCETPHYGTTIPGRSCLDIYQRTSGEAPSGIYRVQIDTIVSVYCDMSPNEPGWTLIESWSLIHYDLYQERPFTQSFSTDEDTPNFDNYRLSKSRMDALVTDIGSTKFRATCNANTVTDVYARDVIQARMSNLDILTEQTSACYTMEIINIRGESCTNCSIAWMFYGHPYVDWKQAQIMNCADLVYVGSGNGQYFGNYTIYNSDFGCTHTAQSTTNYWIKQEFTCSSGCPGHASCTAHETCTCDSGYSGATCSKWSCFGTENFNASVCSSHGACIAPDSCSCTSEYTGSECQYPICFGLVSNDTRVCSNGRGSCIAPSVCQCDNDYHGMQCESHNCFDTVYTNSTVCSSHGNCINPNNCTCDSGYSGSDCSVFECFGVPSTDNTVCSSNGRCIAHDNCTCDNLYFGGNCNESTIVSSSIDYSGSFVPSTDVSQSYSDFPAPSESPLGSPSESPSESPSKSPSDILSGSPSAIPSESGSITESPTAKESSFFSLDSSNEIALSSNIEQPIISVEIKSNSVPGQIFNRRNALAVYVEVSGVDQYLVEWKVLFTNTSVTMKDILVSELSAVLLNTNSIKIPENILKESSNYTFIAQVDILGTQHTKSLQVYTSTPPPLPVLTISPLKGSAEDIFTILVQNRRKIMVQQTLFSFAYSDMNSGKDITLKPFSTSGSLVSKLPAGFGTERILDIQVYAKNEVDGDYSVKSISIIVFKSKLEQVEAEVNNIQTTSETFLAECVTQARNLNDVTPDIDQNQKGRAQSVVEQLLSKIQSVVQSSSSDNRNLFPDVIEMITRNTTLLSDNGRQQTLKLTQEIMNPSSQVATLSIAKVLSNVADTDFSNSQTSQLFTETMSIFVTGILSTKRLSDPVTVIDTTNFKLIVKLDNKSNIENSVYNTTDGNSVVIPRLYNVKTTYNDTIGVTIIQYNHSPYNFSTIYRVDNPVVDVKLYNNQSIIPLRDLSDPIMLTIQNKQTNKCEAKEIDTLCAYWNVTNLEWQSDGCSLTNKSSTEFICACNHTTSFSAFILYEHCAHINRNTAINSIAWNALYIVICIPLLVIIIILRNTQPLRSRFIAPFIGICAILLDSIL